MKGLEALDKEPYSIGRVARSVADNASDIKRSFGDDAGIVQDFIVFIFKSLQNNLFGYTSFTLKDFCALTGRNKQDLCELHPEFKKNPNIKPPEHFGHVFSTVFDYALYNMVQKNIVFSKSYQHTEDGKVIQLDNFPILKSVKLNKDRKSNAVKIYDIRVSDVVMQSFLSGYYTLETSSYKLVGKGRGGDGRKSMFIFLYKALHISLSRKEYVHKFPVDYLSKVAGIEVQENRYRKKSLKRVLDMVKLKGSVPFNYSFVSGDARNPYSEEYHVLLDFTPKQENLAALLEGRGEHVFYIALKTDLQNIFNLTYPESILEDEADVFQLWLTNTYKDLDIKAKIYCKAYERAYRNPISLADARSIIVNGKHIA